MSSPEVPPFGALLAALRRDAGLTQAALAELARVSQRGLQDLERGIHQAPRRDTLDLLVVALGLSEPDRTAFMAAARGQALAEPGPADPLPLNSSGVLVPLVGRAREQALLDRFLAGEGTVGGAARVLVLAGEPGIGKTRLLQAAAQQAVSRGWNVLFGGCQRSGGQDPYAPILEALSRHIHVQRPERRGADLEGCAWLVRLLPELAEMPVRPPSGTLSSEQERRLIFGAVERFLTNVASPAGTLLVLDDLQWAGPDALDLVNALWAPIVTRRCGRRIR
ncbi:MAG: AAA family ATPase [Chloroflexota bacterium]